MNSDSSEAPNATSGAGVNDDIGNVGNSRVDPSAVDVGAVDVGAVDVGAVGGSAVGGGAVDVGAAELVGTDLGGTDLVGTDLGGAVAAGVDLGDVARLSPSSGLCGGPGQISCDEANELIQMVIDHLIDSDEQARLSEHLGDCSPCESEFVVYQRIVSSLTRYRPLMPHDAESRLKGYCADLCDGEGDDDAAAGAVGDSEGNAT